MSSSAAEKEREEIMASALTTFLVVAGVGVGGYALYRWWEEDKKKGDHWRRKEAQHLRDAQVSGYFTGQAVPRPARTVLPDPHNCLCPQSLDPLDPTLPTYTCPCNVPGAIRPPYATGWGYGGYGYDGYGGYFAGQARPTTPPVDPRNCLCPQSLDPLDPTLPTYKCPCNVPGAIRPPYAGYMAVGRGGGGGGGHFHPHQQQQQQQQDQQQDGGGAPGDPNAPPPYQPPPPQQRPYHPHHGRR